MPLRPNPNQKLEELRYGARQGRLPYERDAWLNLAFFLGQQYSEWAGDATKGDEFLREIPRSDTDDRAPRPVVNKIMHYVRQTHHSALQDEPTPDVLPPTDDYQDISDALVAKAWCLQQADENVLDYQSRLSRATLWAIIAGNGYLKWVWNPKTKRLEISAPSYFSIYLDPYAKEFADARYIIQSQFLDTEQVYDIYGVDVQTDSVDKADMAKTAMLRGMGSAPVVQGVTVHELWMKPSRRYPQGQYAVWTGRHQLIAPTSLPYPHLIKENSLPYTHIGCIERPDSPYYLSPIQFLRPPQMELNKYHAQRLMIRELFANPKWWIDAALDLKEDPDGSPGQILRGTSTIPGLKPELIQPTTYPPSDDGEMLEQQMMHLIGQHEVSQAQVPGRVEAAKAIELLKESDDSALATLQKTMRRATSVGWFHGLELARTYGPEEEMVLAYSREGIPEVKHFRAGALKPGYRVRTTTTTGLARSRAARQDLAMRLWDSKVITDPDQLLAMMDVPTNNMLQYRFMDIRLARSENLLIAKGTALQPNSWDDHALHMREHNAYRKTSEFHELDNETKQKFEFHVQAHKELLKHDVAEQAAMNQIMQGGAPGGAQPAATPTPPPDGGQDAAA